jgi:hypothetical protein
MPVALGQVDASLFDQCAALLLVGASLAGTLYVIRGEVRI